MKLFLIQFDGMSNYVEAPSMSEAIAIWHQYRRADDPDWDEPETPEPESCALMHDGSAWRAQND